LLFLSAFDASNRKEDGSKVRACNSIQALKRALKFNELLIKCYGSPGLSAMPLILL